MDAFEKSKAAILMMQELESRLRKLGMSDQKMGEFFLHNGMAVLELNWDLSHESESSLADMLQADVDSAIEAIKDR